jgi:hypothetical protein
MNHRCVKEIRHMHSAQGSGARVGARVRWLVQELVQGFGVGIRV